MPSSLALMKQRVEQKESPWYEAWLEVKATADEALSGGFVAEPYTGDSASELLFALTRQSGNIRDLALVYQVTGDARYGEAGAKMLDAWASANPMPGTALHPKRHYPNVAMNIARGMFRMLETYDLLGTYPNLGAARKARIEQWFRALVDPLEEGAARWKENDYFNKQYYQNHLVAHTVALMSIGYVLGDRELVQYAVDSEENERDFRELIAGMILMPGDAQYGPKSAPRQPLPRAGEIADRYRTVQDHGLAYSHLSLGLMAYGAEMAWNNGVDFWNYTAPGWENLELSFEFYAPIFQTKDTSLQGGYYSGEKLSKVNDWWAAIFEVAYRHYPDNQAIEAYLRAVDRTAIPRHYHSYFAQPTLTHGQPLTVRPGNAAGSAQPSSAAPGHNLLSDPGFEEMGAWESDGAQLSTRPNGKAGPRTGDHVALVGSWGGSGAESVSQVTEHRIEPGQTYRLSAWFNAREDHAGKTKPGGYLMAITAATASGSYPVQIKRSKTRFTDWEQRDLI